MAQGSADCDGDDGAGDRPASVAEFRAGPEDEILGVSFDSMPPGYPEVVHVKPNYWAQRVGIQKGFVVVEVNGIAVESMAKEEFRHHLTSRPLQLAMDCRPFGDSEEDFGDEANAGEEALRHATGETPGAHRRRPPTRRAQRPRARSHSRVASSPPTRAEHRSSVWETVSSSLSWIVAEGSKMASGGSDQPSGGVDAERRAPSSSKDLHPSADMPVSVRRASSRGRRSRLHTDDAASRAADAAVLAAEAATRAANLAVEVSQLREELEAVRTKEAQQAEANTLLRMELHFVKAALRTMEQSGGDQAAFVGTLLDTVRAEQRALLEDLVAEEGCSTPRGGALLRALQSTNPADVSWIHRWDHGTRRCRRTSSGVSAELQEKLERRRLIVEEGHRFATSSNLIHHGLLAAQRKALNERGGEVPPSSPFSEWFYHGSSDEEEGGVQRSLSGQAFKLEATPALCPREDRQSFSMVETSRLTAESPEQCPRKPTVINLIDFAACNNTPEGQDLQPEVGDASAESIAAVVAAAEAVVPASSPMETEDGEESPPVEGALQS